MAATVNDLDQTRLRMGRPLGAKAPKAERSRGQILILFVMAIFVFTGMVALVIDVSWYWVNSLRVQRAADAAALAGVVALPADSGTAYALAREEATKNGYTGSVGLVPITITPVQEPADTGRRLVVTISAPVNMFFMRIFGINDVMATRTAKAEFVLPVPMGSPQNYYGVGNFLTRVTPQNTNQFVNPSGYVVSNPTGGAAPTGNTQTNTSGGAWTNPDRAYTTNDSYATATSNGRQTVWRTFNFGSFASGAIFDGVVLNVEARAGGNATCRITTEVSWNAGSSWGNTARTTPGNLTTADAWYTLGSSTNPAAWGSNHPVWASGDFSSGNFQVRLTSVRGSGTCGTISLDEVTAVVYSHNVTPGTPVETPVTMTGPGGATLAGGSQGFWGADITLGGDRGNGDQFGPDSNGAAANPDFDGKGVDYNVVIAGGSGQVQLFDPTFCETGRNSAGGNFGAGDHWIGGPANPVTTIYTLFDQNGTPYDIGDDIEKSNSGALFAAKTQADYSGTFGDPDHTGLTNCAADPYHNAWWQLANNLPAGSYRLNVTTNVPGNSATNAENMWSAWVSSASGNSQVYGQGKMVTYNNLRSGTQSFYLAQIDQAYAGKTVRINLFDPGDVSGGAWLRVLSPDGDVYTPASFTYTADANASSGHGSGSGICIQTNGGNAVANGVTLPGGCANLTTGGNFYQNSVITIDILLPNTYGETGLTPSGVPGAGWWRIEYTVGGGNDTTTWQVDILGNPVHLIVP